MSDTSFRSERYLRQFFLIAEPFSLTPDPQFLFLSDSHADALAALELGVLERRGLTVLTGEVGTGKTTLAQTVLAQWKNALHVAYLRTGTFAFDEIMRKSLDQFGLNAEGSLSECIDRLAQFLEDRAEENETVVLLIDEAQNLPPETFEQLRLLLNFETEKQKLLQVVLIGQPELEQRLSSHQLRHVEGRIAVRTRLEPLSVEDRAKYVQHRLNRAGATTELFSDPAMKLLTSRSAGIPRRLNVLCHNALLFAFGRGLDTVDLSVAREAVKATQAPGTGRSGLLRDESGQLSAFRVAAVAAGLGLLALGLAFLLRALLPAAPAAELATQTTPAQEAVASPEVSLSQERVEAPAKQVTSAEPPSEQPSGAVSLGPDTEVVQAAAEPKPTAQPASPYRAVEVTAAGKSVRVFRSGETLSTVLYDLYGRYDDDLLQAVRGANPQIEDPDRIRVGAVLNLPDSIEGPRPR